jgi:hypothetical protein
MLWREPRESAVTRHRIGLIAAGVPIFELEWHHDVRLQAPDSNGIQPIEPKTFTPVVAGVAVVVLTRLVKEADLQVRQAGLAALGVEGQSITDRLADDGDPVATCILDERGGGDGGGKSERIREDVYVPPFRQQARQRMGEMPGVGVVATAIAAQVHDESARWLGAKSRLRRREKGRDLLTVRVSDTL